MGDSDDHGDVARPAPVVIVVGAHPGAERDHRPICYALRDRLVGWLDQHGGTDAGTPAVCTDLWYLNDDSLRALPTISVGGPEVNALTAYLGDRIPSAYVIEGRLLVQVDLEFTDVVACCWGIDAGATLEAAEAFADRYLDGFMREAAARALR